MYMRSCPIFSLADAFPILTHLGFDPHSSFWLRISLQISIAQFIKLRFEGDMEKQRKLEITTFMCWLLFVLRPLASYSINLISRYSMDKTPRIQLSGAMGVSGTSSFYFGKLGNRTRKFSHDLPVS